MANLIDDEYEVPLRDQRYFSAGIKRKRIQFVPSTSSESRTQSLPTTPAQSVADKYLSVVLGQPISSAEGERAVCAPAGGSTEDQAGGEADEDPDDGVTERKAEATCDICHRAITTRDEVAPHESSIAHQICLQHSHPPSHIDRRRKGLAVLESQGWDPDGRRGLGAGGEGLLYPVKAKENPERAGLGVKAKHLKLYAREKPTELDAGKVRLMEKEGKKKAAELRDAFYRSDDVEKYLGAGGQVNGWLDLAAFRRAKRR